MIYLVFLAAVLAVFAFLIVSNDRRFERMVKAEITETFRQRREQPTRTFTTTDLADLPEPVQRYLQRSLKEGQLYIETVRLKQIGSLRLSPTQAWKPFTAEQYFTVNPPAFVWRVKVNFSPLIWVKGRDKYVNRQAEMLIKLLSTLPVARAHDPKTTAGALIRYVAELFWFPTALVNNPNLRWEAVDAASVKLVMCDGEIVAPVTLHFDENGDIVKLVCEERYRSADDPRPTRWHVSFSEYREFEGVRIPSQGEVGWEPETGYYSWFRASITDIEFNVPAQY